MRWRSNPWSVGIGLAGGAITVWVWLGGWLETLASTRRGWVLYLLVGVPLGLLGQACAEVFGAALAPDRKSLWVIGSIVLAGLAGVWIYYLFYATW